MTNQTTKPKIINSKIIPSALLLLVFLLFFFVGYVTIKEVVNRRALDNQIAALNDEVSHLQGQQQNFLTSIDRYRSDFYVEKEARSKLNMKKAGEEVVVVKLEDINKLRAQSEINNNINNTAKNNPMRWWRYFFGEE